MQNKTKIFFFFIVLLLFIGLVACNNSNSVIKDAKVNENNELIIELANGDLINAGIINVEKGEKGDGIKTISINEAGELIVLLTDGTTLNLGLIKGEKGDKGDKGEPGPKGDKGEPGETIIPDMDVLFGIDRIDEYLDLFEGKRVGLITNPTGVNSNYESTIDILFDKVNLVALFAPEHGIRGDLQAGAHAPTYIDKKTGLTVYSLYGSTQKPTKEMMDEVDIMCIDIQDAGARFYTYIYTMSYAMEACAQYDKTFIVFDRPNPVGGHIYEGNILDPMYSSFVGRFPIIQRHGMTIAELAYLFNQEYGIYCDLEVVLMGNWERNMFYDDTNLPWVVPSPNLPTNETAIVYTGTCIFEGTNLSEGRGTTTPFEVIGAPYIDANQFSDALNDLGLEGVKFRPAYFTPTFSKHFNLLCAGVQVHVTDRETFNAVKTGYAMLEIVRDLYPNDFSLTGSLNRLVGNSYISERLYTLEEQFDLVNQDTINFGLIREQYLLY